VRLLNYERVGEILDLLIAELEPKVIVIDSIHPIFSIGLREIEFFIRSLVNRVVSRRMLLLITNHMNSDSLYGTPTPTSMTWGLSRYVSDRIYLSSSKFIYDAPRSIVGQKVRIKKLKGHMDKNPVTLPLLYGAGFIEPSGPP
jgi:hypothetical protein